MTKIAEALANGPFHGFFHEGATLYRLDPPVVAGGPTSKGIKTVEVEHIIVCGLPADDLGNGPEVVVFAAEKDGGVSTSFHMRFGTVLALTGHDDHHRALARLGYAVSVDAL